MNFTTEQQAGSVIMRLSGQMRGDESMVALRDFIIERLCEGCRNFIINCQDIEHADHIGISSLSSIMLAIQQAGGKMTLCNTKPIEMVLNAVGSRISFDIVLTEEDV